ncbi:hypothetical protein CU098_009630 [Rhizopus stolonifer]|uniref:SHSP domain-containing protein n=1 Tax=Rhizopus stolonifer TaxID=4846 RepID=A0A367JAC5_RHIST|nr:hypothetical protein CU098_009630 [Rhizopus stolonifer]
MALSHRLFHDTLRDLQRAMDAFSVSFNTGGDNVFGASNFPTHSTLGSRYPVTDIVEEKDHYEVNAEVPGSDKNNIKIEVPDTNTLVLSGTKKHERHEELKQEVNKQKEKADIEGQALQKKEEGHVTEYAAPNWWVNERVVGSFYRTYTFPNPIDPDSIKAHFENGILKIMIPKVSKPQSKLINIE